jgi:hypothetical protein
LVENFHFDPFLSFDPFSTLGATKLFASLRIRSKRYLNAQKSVLC